MTHIGGEAGWEPEGSWERPAAWEPDRGQRNLPVRYQRTGPPAVPAAPAAPAAAQDAPLPELGTLVRKHGIVITGIVLIAGSLVWKAEFLSRYSFWQDDFHFIELALSHPFSWSYLTYVGAGHMFPAVYAIIWVLARGALYDWGAATAVTIVLLAAAGLAALRLLRTLFGNRPVVLVLLVIYLVSPLTMPDIRWWSAAIEAIPLQIAIFMALTAQVWYVRTGRFRHGLAATAWVFAGLLFFEKAVVLPALLFGITSAFLVEGPWLRSMLGCLKRFWAEWLLQLALLGIYAAVLQDALHTSTVQPGAPSSAGSALSFAGTLVKDTLVPGALGGPWDWFAQSSKEWAYAAPPDPAAWVSLLVAAGVVLASVAARRYAWRAWAVLAGWVLAADIVPVLIGRLNGPGGSAALLGLETRYLPDAVPVLVICLGLAFLPLAGQPDVRKRIQVSSAEMVRIIQAAAAVLALACIAGSVYSVQKFSAGTTGQPVASYLANARLALAQAPPGTVIADGRVPSGLMLGTFKQFSDDSRVLGPMESPAARARIRWTARPDGTIDSLLEFGPDGRLHRAGVYGVATFPLPRQTPCYKPHSGQLTVSFPRKSAPGSTELHLAYLAAAAVGGTAVTVRYGGRSQQLTLKAGLHNAYLPVMGSATKVTVSGPAVTRSALCVSGAQAGVLVAAPTGQTIPAT